jgi:hypothetical protein
MPREQRLILSENLRKFDALTPGQKAAIRDLDERISRLPAENRMTYNSVLRRYHLWVQGLSKEQKDLLNAASPEQRMALLRKFLAEERSTASRPTPLFLQIADLNAPSPFDVAHRLKVWFALTPAERAETERLPPEKRRPHLEELGRKKKVGAMHRLTRAEEEKALDHLQANALLKDRLNRLAELKRIAEAGKKTDEVRKAELARRKVADNYHFEKVGSENLMRFNSALPSWIRAPLDHLPPEEARRRLTILYRLVFPAGSEMPADFKPASPAPPAASPAPNQGKAPPTKPRPASTPEPF